MEQTFGRIDLNDNILYHQVYIGEGVKAFVYLSRKGKYHIFIADTLSPEAQAEVLAHEIYHIKHDMPSGLYIVGLDAQRSTVEANANTAAKRYAPELLALISIAT